MRAAFRVLHTAAFRVPTGTAASGFAARFLVFFRQNFYFLTFEVAKPRAALYNRVDFDI